MCLIIDANCASLVLGGADPGDLALLRDALFSQRRVTPRLVHGGKLTDEYLRAGVLNVVAQLERAGRARVLDGRRVNAETKAVARLCRSNDPHIIAVARVGGVRLLVSHDRELHRDFKDAKLLSKPRGRIYSARGHRRLVDQACAKAH